MNGGDAGEQHGVWLSCCLVLAVELVLELESKREDREDRKGQESTG